jgi:hypothetical protein
MTYLRGLQIEAMPQHFEGQDMSSLWQLAQVSNRMIANSSYHRSGRGCGS